VDQLLKTIIISGMCFFRLCCLGEGGWEMYNALQSVISMQHSSHKSSHKSLS
jgi:hypothetical protein